MNTTLLSAGAAAIILAVVGGGASVLGATVPVIPTLKRQVALGLVGVAFIGLAVLLRDTTGNDGTNNDVHAYQQRVVAACHDLVQVGRELPPFSEGGTIDRDRYLAWLRGQVATSEGILSALWERPVPDELSDERTNARDDARDFSKRAQSSLRQLEQALPTRFPLFPDPPAVIQQVNTEIAASRARLNGSLSELAGEPCSPQ
jgi:hypothetical protein